MNKVNPGIDLNGIQYDILRDYIIERVKRGKFDGEINLGDYANKFVGKDISKVKFKIVITNEE